GPARVHEALAVPEGLAQGPGREARKARQEALRRLSRDDRGMPEALVIVDFQNDFTPGGALAVPHGDEIAGRIEELLDSGRFDLVVATRDWHPPDHGSFEAQGGPWPPHCVA